METEGLTIYDPSDKDREILDSVYERMWKMQHVRDKSYRYFNDRKLLDFIDDSTKRWNGYIPPRDDLTEDWQARVFNNFTHNIVIAFLSKAAMNRPKARFVATNKKGFVDTLRAHVLEKMYEYSYRRENGEWKFFNSALENVTKGTVIAYEGFRKLKRKVKEVSKYDPVTGKIEYDEKEITDYNDCYREIIPLEDFYIPNIWQSELQLQPDVIWKSIMKKSEAEMEFRKYQNWKYVKPGEFTTVLENSPFYKDKYFFELERDQIELIRYFNKNKDQMVITANGVLLYEGPIPFNHKQYPFAKTVFEPFAIDFFYGNSLPNKVSQEQDVSNTLLNMMLDQTALSIHKPILTDDPDPIESTLNVPGLIMPVNDINRYRVMSEFTGPDSSTFNMFQLVTQKMQEDSGNMMGGGPATTARGGKVTARQALMQAEQAQQVLGLNTKLLEFFECDLAKLRCKNILQFMTIPEKNKDITGEDDPMGLFSRTLRVDDSDLSDGTHGTSILRIVGDKESLPSEDSLDVEEEAAAIQGENIEIHAITPDYIRNIEFDIQIIPESSFQQSKSIEQALGIEFYQMMIQNPLINQEENTKEVLKIYDKDADKFMKQMTPNPEQMQGMPPTGMPMQSQGQPQRPQQPQNSKLGQQMLGRGEQTSLGSLL